MKSTKICVSTLPMAAVLACRRCAASDRVVCLPATSHGVITVRDGILQAEMGLLVSDKMRVT
jgi:hypothetical protein